MDREWDDKSDALVAAARLLFTNEGSEALTVSRIASEAGMSTMILYSRFDGKDGVVDELYCDGHRQLGRILTAVPITGDATRDLTALADEYRAFAITNPEYHRLMYRALIPGFEPSSRSIAVAYETLKPLYDRVVDGQASGELPGGPAPGDPTRTSAWLWAGCHGLVSLELDGVGAAAVGWAEFWADAVHSLVSVLLRSPTDAPLVSA